MAFPPLPDDRDNPWPANVQAAHTIISESYHRITNLLRRDDLDPIQLNHHASTLTHETIPMLEAIQNDRSLDLLETWLRDAATHLGEALSDILHAAARLGEGG
jgi:inactivated superfamily I helicase